MEEIITREKAKRLMKLEGGVMGVAIKADVQFVLKEKGKEGLKKIEEELDKLGHPLKLKEIKATNFYPLGMRAILLLTMKKVCGFSDQDIMRMGSELTKFPSLIRKFIGFFLKDRKIFFQYAPKNWNRFVKAGKLSIPSYDEEKGIHIARLENFDVDPIFCPYLEGVFLAFTKIAVGAPKATVEEIKCSFKGDDYHEYLFKWNLSNNP